MILTIYIDVIMLTAKAKYAQIRLLVSLLVFTFAFQANGISQIQTYSPHLTESTHIVEHDYEIELGNFADNRAFIKNKKNGKWMLINEEARVLLSDIPINTFLREYPYFNHGHSLIRIQEDGAPRQYYCILDKNGKVTHIFPDDILDFCDNFSEGYIIGKKLIKDKGTYRSVIRYYDTTGKEVFPNLWCDYKFTDYSSSSKIKKFRPFQNGLSCFLDYNTGFYGYCDKKGNIIIPAKYKKAHDFSEGKAAVSKDGDIWLFIDTLGSQCIQRTFSVEEPRDFHDGYAIVFKRNSNGRNSPCYINDKGDIVAGPFGEAHSFIGGYAWVEIPDSQKGVIWAVVNTKFEVVRKFERLASFYREEHLFQFNYSDNTKESQSNDVFYPDGTLAFEKPDYDFLRKQFYDGVAIVFIADNGHIVANGYMKKNGEIFMIFKPSEF